MPRYFNTNLHGIVVVDKPFGMSSSKAVQMVRRAAGNCKTGHAGTLDPLATGVLVCALGKATKTISSIMAQPKTYETRMDLSAFTGTDDAEGKREEVEVRNPPTVDEVRAALARFIGEIEQTPPLYSAVKIDGRAAYKYARKGQEVQIEPRLVHIHEIELLDYDWPFLAVRIKCGKGTYIRSLARQLGEALGTGGYLKSLRRTAVGLYVVEGAITEDELKMELDLSKVLPMPDLKEDAPSISPSSL